jgi:hypothetical protein
MKKTTTLFFLACSILLTTASAQTYLVIAKDTIDAPSFTKDLKSVSYALDTAQDSLWIKLTYYNDIGGDFGSALGFDTNATPLDGQTWGGANTSLKPDTSIYLERNGFFETDIRTSSTLIRSITEVDTVTLVLNLAFSSVAPSGTLNLIAGTGSFDISLTKTVYDDAPDSDYATIPIKLTGIDEMTSSPFSIFPNPAQHVLNVVLPEGTTNGNYRIYTLDGRQVGSWNANTTQIDVSKFNQGMYLLIYENESGNRDFSKFQVIHY